MPAWLAKVALSLIGSDSKNVAKIGCGCLVLLISPLLIMGSFITMFFHIPFGKPDHFKYYSNAVKRVQQETRSELNPEGVSINWQMVMAIDAVLLKQDFDKSSPERAYNMAKKFIWSEEVLISQTCYTVDDQGNQVPYDCSYYVTVYHAYSFDEVLEHLIDDGLLQPNQIEDVKRYITFDYSHLAEEDLLPPDWRPYERDYAWPTPGNYRVTSFFGPRVDPVEFVHKEHTGIDIAVPTGTNVVSVKNGTVTFANRNKNYGYMIKIKHDDLSESWYAHLSKYKVKKGDRVNRGDIIALSGNSGKSTGPHLHLEIWEHDQRVDPLQFYR